MKNLLILPFLVLPCMAYADDTQSLHDIVAAIVQNAPAESVVATGPRGDTLIKVAATDEIVKIYNEQEKTAMFVSVNFNEYIEDGYCLINNDTEYNTYRVFCGTAQDITDAFADMENPKFYAVAL